MKKLSVILLLAVTISLCSCGEPAEESRETTAPAQTTTETTTAEIAETTETTTASVTTKTPEPSATTRVTVAPTTARQTTTKKPTTTAMTTRKPVTLPSAGKKLIWSDEFNGSEINTENWGYERGRVRNGEPQYYTVDRKENARVENGNLILEARKESYEGCNFTSASLISQGKQSFQYGIFEIRCKMPTGRGTWPAFWTLGNSHGWPKGGEIDIFEWYGSSPQVLSSTVHWTGLAGQHVQEGVGSYLYEGPESSNLSNEFHVFGMVWTASKIEFYGDYGVYGTLRISGENMRTAFRQPHFILVNLALQGGTDPSSFKNTQYIVDYVRVYEN